MALLKILTHKPLIRRFVPTVYFCQYFQQSTSTYQNNHNTDNIDNKQPRAKKIGIVLGVTTGLYLYLKKKQIHAAASEKQIADKVVEHLPTFTASDVSKHDSKEKKIWCSYKKGVYDITNFVEQHPGGDKIFLAAGGALEPFWMLYAAHQTEQVLEILEKYRIGNLDASDQGVAESDMSDPYMSDPIRHPALKPISTKPFNAEPPLSILSDSFRTPNDLFYVRNHLPVPVIDGDKYELEVEIDGREKSKKCFSLKDLKNNFPKHSVTATIQCAGNRRSEMHAVKPIRGLTWTAGAIGNATWTGARLKDVLCKIGVNEKNVFDLKHVQFEGFDLDPEGKPYGASILFEKAMDEDVLLAYTMNGEPLSPDHGFPVRVIVPGIVGARNVKWLSRIVVSQEESDSFWQQKDYKSFPPHINWETVDFSTAPAIQELPVQSVICEPTPGQQISRTSENCVKVKGYAWSGGGRGIIRVDVSADGGQNWVVAKLKPSEMKVQRSWAWTLWEAEVPIPQNNSKTTLTLCCRAVDSSYNTQPECVARIWNLRGVVNNAWHRVKVDIMP